jgi:hypothetical protein
MVSFRTGRGFYTFCSVRVDTHALPAAVIVDEGSLMSAIVRDPMPCRSALVKKYTTAKPQLEIAELETFTVDVRIQVPLREWLESSFRLSSLDP